MLKLTTIIFLISLALLAVLHNLAITFSLYWYYWWFDLPMHFFGGSIITLGLFTLNDLKFLPKRFLRGLLVAVFALAIMVSWEIFELCAGIQIQNDYVLDTVLDIMMGSIGATVGFLVARQLRTL